MKAILTPEQFSKMEALKEKCMKECKEKYKDRLKGEGHCDEEKGR
jgi:Spy/CpxP family protein refolding chaperone